jgi:excisionase family DNA binding protein
MQQVEERYYTTRQVAERLGVHEATVRRWLEEGRLRGVKLPGGRSWRITETELNRALRETEGTR